MSNFLLKMTLQRKLAKLNKIIDNKIQQGKGYRRESKLHRSVRQQMHMIDRLSRV